jgi:hypothetical protein
LSNSGRMDLTWLPDPSSLGMATMPNPCAMSLAFSSAMGVAYPSTLGLARLPDSWLLNQIWLSNSRHLVFVRLSDPIILDLTRLPDSSSLSLTWLSRFKSAIFNGCRAFNTQQGQPYYFTKSFSNHVTPLKFLSLPC